MLMTRFHGVAPDHKNRTIENNCVARGGPVLQNSSLAVQSKIRGRADQTRSTSRKYSPEEIHYGNTD